MKIIVECPYPEGKRVYSYEDESWDSNCMDVLEIMLNLMRQMTFNEKSIQNCVLAKAEEYETCEELSESDSKEEE